MSKTSIIPVLKLALRSLLYKEVLLCLFAPLFLAILTILFLLLFFGVDVFAFFGDAVRSAISAVLLNANFLPMEAKDVLNQAVFGAGGAVGVLLFVVLMIPVFVAIGSLVASVISSTYLISFLAKKHFSELQRRGSLGLIRSQLHAFFYSALYLLLSFLALPLIFFPPVSLTFQVALTAWLTQKITAYDVLGDWCNRSEFEELTKQTSRSAFTVSFVTSLTMVLPLAFVITPVLTSLTLTIYYFSALTEIREGKLRS